MVSCLSAAILRIERIEGAAQILVDGHSSARVVVLAGVVGSGEQCDELTTAKEFRTVLNNLKN